MLAWGRRGRRALWHAECWHGDGTADVLRLGYGKERTAEELLIRNGRSRQGVARLPWGNEAGEEGPAKGLSRRSRLR